jgi:hypothetical protein
LILSIIGFFTVRMPWLEYPKIDLVLEGRNGVGWFTSMLFFIIFLLVLLLLFYKKRDRLLGGSVFGVGAFLTIIGLEKIIRFFLEWKHESSDLFLINLAGAGVILKYGVYVLTVSAGLITILAIPFIFTTFFEQSGRQRAFLNYVLIFITAIGALIAYAELRPVPEVSQEQVVSAIKNDYVSMNKVLMDGDYDKVVNYTHPTIYQSLGGIERYKQVLQEVKTQALRADVRVDDVVKYVQKGENVQAIFHHTTVFSTPEGSETVRGSSFGFSNDVGKTWVFVGINGKSFPEMKKDFPDIFDELNYSVGQPITK